MDARLLLLTSWLESTLSLSVTLTPLAGDASFRRYFRLTHNNESFIAMDSPPDKENCEPFIALAKRFYQANLKVPRILAQDKTQGFLLLDDFGDQLYHYELNEDNADQLYRAAIHELVILQKNYQQDKEDLPHFGYDAMLNELTLFTDWFLNRYLNLDLSTDEKKMLNESYHFLLDSAVNQPQTLVHRDYHSRNLMILPGGEVGILDFQDAVVGPVTYDLASLLRDCYIDWPNEMVKTWALVFLNEAQQARLLQNDITDDVFLRWFDLMGMQRHLKAIFIFARKSLRDQHNFYLQFIPRALNYVMNVGIHYSELRGLMQFFQIRVLPAWQQTQKEIAI